MALSSSQQPGQRSRAVRWLLIFLGILVVSFAAIQLIPVSRTNPPVTSEPNWDSPETRALAQRACFDCHSNETQWPWYAYVAPVSWLVARDTVEGREELNFSEWGTRREEAEEIVEVILEAKMPLPIYILMHPEANLTDAERSQLAEGLRATLR